MQINDVPFMPWIDYLSEVGDPIRRDRTRLQELAAEAVGLEEHAAALRVKVAQGKGDLLDKVLKHWTLHDMQNASQAAYLANPATHTFNKVEDAPLRECLRTLDGNWHLASEALQIFHDAGVLRPIAGMSGADSDELLALARRVMAWWEHVGKPVFERLTSANSKPTIRWNQHE